MISLRQMSRVRFIDELDTSARPARAASWAARTGAYVPVIECDGARIEATIFAGPPLRPRWRYFPGGADARCEVSRRLCRDDALLPATPRRHFDWREIFTPRRAADEPTRFRLLVSLMRGDRDGWRTASKLYFHEALLATISVCASLTGSLPDATAGISECHRRHHESASSAASPFWNITASACLPHIYVGASSPMALSWSDRGTARRDCRRQVSAPRW